MLYNTLVWLGTLMLVACAAVGASSPGQDRNEKAASKANSRNTFDASKLSRQTQLAIEVEVTDKGVKPVRASIVRAPVKTSSAIRDLLVRTQGGGRTIIHEYAIADPRLVEVERGGTKVLPVARTFIYVPLSPEADNVEVTPIRGREKFASRGAAFDIRPWAVVACRERPEIRTCAEILGKRQE